jgi:hypothetical protein
LVTQVELALLAGRTLEQIEAEILDRCEVDELGRKPGRGTRSNVPD